MNFHQFLPAFAMMETIRKGGTHWECFPSSGFIVYKGDKHISYSYACLEVEKTVDISALDLSTDCSVLFFPHKRGNNILILTNKYISSITDNNQLQLTQLDKTQILYSDCYEIGKNDIRDEHSCGVQERPLLDTQDCGNC